MGWLEYEVERIQSRIPGKSKCKWFVIGMIATIIFMVAFFLLIPAFDDICVTVIRVDGKIVAGNVYSDDSVGSEEVGRQLRNAADDSLVKAIVLRVNSPGGSPAGAQEIIQDMEYAKKKKPVVVSMGDMAISAAYHISSHADLIFANPDTTTGNIGTIWTFYDYSEYLKKEGISIDVVKSGEVKDLGAQYRSLSDEEREYVQMIVDNSSDMFISDVVKQRGVNRSVIEGARIFRGEEALKLGLVDEMGNLYAAIEKARELA